MMCRLLLSLLSHGEENLRTTTGRKRAMIRLGGKGSQATTSFAPPPFLSSKAQSPPPPTLQLTRTTAEKTIETAPGLPAANSSGEVDARSALQGLPLPSVNCSRCLDSKKLVSTLFPLLVFLFLHASGCRPSSTAPLYPGREGREKRRRSRQDRRGFFASLPPRSLLVAPLCHPKQKSLHGLTG